MRWEDHLHKRTNKFVQFSDIGVSGKLNENATFTTLIIKLPDHWEKYWNVQDELMPFMIIYVDQRSYSVHTLVRG